ncbi:uncharacterized protein LOC119166698 isoform X3 [Rhipicephalus microplus]|uniref:uncharacterized protein LOC119166698 isoform X3 n=1 Tax=Rhipicephalus microplus TaxID=6941 RepID=UPI003F6D98F7
MKHNVTAGERWDTASIARSARVFLPCVLQRSLTGLGATAIRRVNGAYSTHKKCTGPSTEAWGTPEVTPEEAGTYPCGLQLLPSDIVGISSDLDLVNSFTW